jgi:uncharacterized delta-60 repeat protein
MMINSNFSVSGSYHADFSGIGLEDKAVAVKIDSYQRIVIAGYAHSGDTSTRLTPIVNFFVARFSSTGQPDPTFGINGRTVTAIPGIEAEEVTSMEIQPDGKIIVGGSGVNYGIGPCQWAGSFILVRYNTDGTLDNTFGDNGIVFTNFTWFNDPVGNSSDILTCLKLQPDGKILAGGYGNLCREAVRRSNLARYHPNGTVDSTFGLYGKFTYNSQDINEWLLDISAPEAGGDGSFYAVGAETEWLLFFPNKNRIYKFDAFGHLVQGFGSDGAIIDPRPGLTGSQYAHDIAIGPDGKLYLLGCTGSAGLLWFMRKNPLTGADDPGFGTDGVVVHDHPEAAIPGSLVFRNNMMITGHHTLDGFWSTSRFSLNGVFDVSYGWPKMQVNNYTDEPTCMTLTPNGKILMTGSGIFFPGENRDVMLVQFDTNSTRFLQSNTYNAGQPGCISSNETIYTRNQTITSTGSLSLNASKNVRIFSNLTVANGGYFSVKIHPNGYFCTKEAAMTSTEYSDFSEETMLQPGESQNHKLAIFPNPTEGQCVVSWSGFNNTPDEVTIQLFNQIGKKVEEFHCNGNYQTGIDLSGQSKGVYLINVFTGTQRFCGKVIKTEPR